MAVQYTFTSSDIEDLSNSGVTLTVNGVEVSTGSTVNDGDSLVATCESGREFFIDKDPVYNNTDILSIYFYQFDSWSYKTYYAEFSTNDNKTATLTMPDKINDGIGNKNFIFYVATVQALPEVEGTNNIYSINKDILDNVNSERFKVEVSTGTGGSVSDTVLDYGKFIISVLSLPFKIPDENIVLEDDIILGDLNTAVRANKINSDLLRFNMGMINLENYSNNSLDYVGTETFLHLPYLTPFKIDIEYVLDSILTIEYVLDCYTGVATANVYSDKIDSPIVSKQFSLGVNIPVANSKYGINLINSNIETINDNGVKTPFIEIVKPDFPLIDSEFTIPVKDNGILNNVSGYVVVDNIRFNSDLTSEVQNMIESLLKEGVFIND